MITVADIVISSPVIWSRTRAPDGPAAGIVDDVVHGSMIEDYGSGLIGGQRIGERESAIVGSAS